MTIETFDPDGQAEPAEVDVAEFIDELTAMAHANAEAPVPLAAGTFVLYPMPDGGVMFVTAVDEGLLAGIKHTRIPPGLIRAVSVIAGGGSKRAAIAAMFRGGRKEIGDGR